MSSNLIFLLILISCLMYLTVFIAFLRGRMPLKYTLVWLIPATILLLAAIVPMVLEEISRITGMFVVSNLVIGILFVILILICFALTIIVSGQDTKIKLLIQEISILKAKIEEKGDK